MTCMRTSRTDRWTDSTRTVVGQSVRRPPLNLIVVYYLYCRVYIHPLHRLQRTNTYEILGGKTSPALLVLASCTRYHSAPGGSGLQLLLRTLPGNYTHDNYGNNTRYRYTEHIRYIRTQRFARSRQLTPAASSSTLKRENENEKRENGKRKKEKRNERTNESSGTTARQEPRHVSVSVSVSATDGRCSMLERCSRDGFPLSFSSSHPIPFHSSVGTRDSAGSNALGDWPGLARSLRRSVGINAPI